VTTYNVRYEDRSAKFKIEKGQLAVQLYYGETFKRNIWTIPKKQATKEVLAALANAVNVGIDLHRENVYGVLHTVQIDVQHPGVES
jgi:predicted membrane-bound dolichyl-phosphate-mannose-protein mannosyltransferase